jgi:hypothetical protein
MNPLVIVSVVVCGALLIGAVYQAVLAAGELWTARPRITAPKAKECDHGFD